MGSKLPAEDRNNKISVKIEDTLKARIVVNSVFLSIIFLLVTSAAQVQVHNWKRAQREGNGPAGKNLLEV